MMRNLYAHRRGIRKVITAAAGVTWTAAGITTIYFMAGDEERENGEHELRTETQLRLLDEIDHTRNMSVLFLEENRAMHKGYQDLYEKLSALGILNVVLRQPEHWNGRHRPRYPLPPITFEPLPGDITDDKTSSTPPRIIFPPLESMDQLEKMRRSTGNLTADDDDDNNRTTTAVVVDPVSMNCSLYVYCLPYINWTAMTELNELERIIHRLGQIALGKG